jgi:hypothetical protein
MPVSRLGERALALQNPYLEGEDVRAWQRIIQTHPTLGTPRLQVSGVFDELTDAVTRIWQAEHGLTTDGVVGATSLVESRATSLITTLEGDVQPQYGLLPARTEVEDILARRRAEADARVKGV